MSNNELKLKYIILGNTNVGKTTIIKKYIKSELKSIEPTIGFDYIKKSITIKDKNINLNIWDTSGQENYNSLTKNYFNSSVGAILVFDLTSKYSFDSLDYWFKELEYNNGEITYILVGNKIDEVSKREVYQEHIDSLCNLKNINYIECSAKSNINIDLIFDLLTKNILKKIEKNIISLNDTKNEFNVNFFNKKINENNTCCIIF